MPPLHRLIAGLGAWLALAAALAAQEAPSPVRFEPQFLPFRLESAESSERRAPETMAGGVAAFDYDGDGDLDLFFANGAELPDAVKTSDAHSNRLYRNDGGMRFEDVTAEAGLAGSGFDFGAAVADYDNDGDPDLFVAGLRRSTLYRNDGDGTFTDVTAGSGVSADDAEHGPLWAVAGAWLDYDTDGRLDLFIVNYLRWKPGADPVCTIGAERDYCHPKLYPGLPNQLYRNLGDGRFEDVSEASGIRSHVGKGMGAAVADFNRDGRPDIFVTNDKLPNFLFLNNGRGGFDEEAFLVGVALPEHGRDVSGMGVDARDVDNDGRSDIVYTALPGETFPLLIASPDGSFEDVGFASGLAGQTRSMAGYSAIIADFDNDGWKDLFFSRGDVQAHAADNAPPVEQPNAVFRNLGGGRFAALTAEAGFADAPPGRHRGAAVGDFDGDGRLDLAVTAMGKHAVVWRNRGSTDASWLAVKLEGVVSVRDGIGATVEVAVDGRTYWNNATTSFGYASSSAGPLHLGLGAAKGPARVTIRWPSGAVQTVEAVRLRQSVVIREVAGPTGGAE